MNKKFIVLVFVLILIVGVISVSLWNYQPSTDNVDSDVLENTSQSTSNNSTNTRNGLNDQFTNHNGVTDKNNVQFSLNGPKSVSQGTNIGLKIKITNNGDSPITNVESTWRGGNHDFGTINPGESKEFTTNSYVISNNNIMADFGSDSVLSNEPLFLGGFGLKYLINGVEYNSRSNSLEIPYT
ncbi:hypothetical protein MBCUT_08190 [Methanobrevibacter cuticularis]|uniref:Uncharacterized protein n=1 Tax=Methanobrevibacter cuticularis TaxID=47311 RepID=A0A166EA03_9EURY|nr:hypothetical protein [Methanobrevibacter cuticularis]KZX16433.1 hypothetical protein MBCUT_08190 [Methanobrevibacter cuticularis]